MKQVTLTVNKDSDKGYSLIDEFGVPWVLNDELCYEIQTVLDGEYARDLVLLENLLMATQSEIEKLIITGISEEGGLFNIANVEVCLKDSLDGDTSVFNVFDAESDIPIAYAIAHNIPKELQEEQARVKDLAKKLGVE
jgi:hypothetical protein